MLPAGAAHACARRRAGAGAHARSGTPGRIRHGSARHAGAQRLRPQRRQHRPPRRFRRRLPVPRHGAAHPAHLRLDGGAGAAARASRLRLHRDGHRGHRVRGGVQQLRLLQRARAAPRYQPAAARHRVLGFGAARCVPRRDGLPGLVLRRLAVRRRGHRRPAARAVPDLRVRRPHRRAVGHPGAAAQVPYRVLDPDRLDGGPCLRRHRLRLRRPGHVEPGGRRARRDRLQRAAELRRREVRAAPALQPRLHRLDLAHQRQLSRRRAAVLPEHERRPGADRAQPRRDLARLLPERPLAHRRDPGTHRDADPACALSGLLGRASRDRPAAGTHAAQRQRAGGDRRPDRPRRVGQRRRAGARAVRRAVARDDAGDGDVRLQRRRARLDGGGVAALQRAQPRRPVAALQRDRDGADGVRGSARPALRHRGGRPRGGGHLALRARALPRRARPDRLRPAADGLPARPARARLGGHVGRHRGAAAARRAMERPRRRAARGAGGGRRTGLPDGAAPDLAPLPARLQGARGALFPKR